MWNRALHTIVESPLIGIGIGTFEQKHVRMHTIIPNLITVRAAGEFQERCQSQSDPNGGMNAHNGYLNTWTDLGLVGLGLFLWLVWELLRCCRVFSAANLRQSAPARAYYLPGTWSATVAMLTLCYMCVAGIAEGYVFYGPIAPMYLVISYGRLVAMTHTLNSVGQAPPDGQSE
jgi:O-antigen ligase